MMEVYNSIPKKRRSTDIEYLTEMRIKVWDDGFKVGILVGSSVATVTIAIICKIKGII
jgi:hypothetical protein